MADLFPEDSPFDTGDDAGTEVSLARGDGEATVGKRRNAHALRGMKAGGRGQARLRAASKGREGKGKERSGRETETNESCAPVGQGRGKSCYCGWRKGAKEEGGQFDSAFAAELTGLLACQIPLETEAAEADSATAQLQTTTLVRCILSFLILLFFLHRAGECFRLESTRN